MMHATLVGCRLLCSATLALLLIFPTGVQAQFNNPESVAYDAQANRYLISNQGDGNILQQDAAGNVLPFNSDATQARGLLVHEGTLYAVTDNVTVRAIDLATGTTTQQIDVAEAGFLNDITMDADGLLYVTDSAVGRVFKINPATGTVNQFTGQDFIFPNGIVYDPAGNRLLVVSFRVDSPIAAVSLADSSVTVARETRLSQLDGIVIDDGGNVYVSSWMDNAIYRFPPDLSGSPEQVSMNHNGPADIGYNAQENLVAVPNFNGNTVEFVTVGPVANEDEAVPGGFQVAHAYPNPFTHTTTLAYTLAEAGPVRVQVYSLLGQPVRTLADAYQPAGAQTVAWDGRTDGGTQAPSGPYIFSIQTQSAAVSRMVTLVR